MTGNDFYQIDGETRRSLGFKPKSQLNIHYAKFTVDLSLLRLSLYKFHEINMNYEQKFKITQYPLEKRILSLQISYRK